jgi:hypothetical protein
LLLFYTGKVWCALPAMAVTKCFTPGSERNVPITGSRFKKINTVGKKALNKTRKPYPSTHIPARRVPRPPRKVAT